MMHGSFADCLTRYTADTASMGARSKQFAESTPHRSNVNKQKHKGQTNEQQPQMTASLLATAKLTQDNSLQTTAVEVSLIPSTSANAMAADVTQQYAC